MSKADMKIPETSKLGKAIPDQKCKAITDDVISDQLKPMKSKRRTSKSLYDELR